MKPSTPLLRIGRRLTKFRKEAGLTQVELAEAAEVHIKTIQALEWGKAAPLVVSMIRIARVLGKPIDAFTRTAPNQSKLLARILKQLEKLDVQDLEAVGAVIEALASKSKRAKTMKSSAT